MRGKGRVQRTSFSLTGCLLLFFSVVLVASTSILLYTFVDGRSGGDRTVTALVTFGYILALTCAAVAVDFARRKLTVERSVRAVLDAAGRIASGDFTVCGPLHPWGKYDEYDVILEHLGAAARELARTETLHADFVANVSHELKTPLAVISSAASAVRDGNLRREELRENAEMLVATARRLSDLVSNILKLNKLENQEIYPALRPFDLAEQLRRCVLDVCDRADEKNLSLECEIGETTARSDPELLEIVWNNLLSNAVKFTPAGGTVRVSLSEENGRAVVCVSDTGCGMSAETGARIFDKFYQGDASHAQEGNGLGLALVKKVIGVLGGEIAVESAPGAGSAFTVRIDR